MHHSRRRWSPAALTSLGRGERGLNGPVRDEIGVGLFLHRSHCPVILFTPSVIIALCLVRSIVCQPEDVPVCVTGDGTICAEDVALGRVGE